MSSGMKSLLLLLIHAALATLSVAVNHQSWPNYLPCGIWFPLSNETLSTLAALQRGEIDPQSLGAVDLFTDNSEAGPKPWPRGKDKLIKIPYCYETNDDRTKLQQGVEGAIKIWMNALGGQASQANGHALVFEEVNENGQPLFCTDVTSKVPDTWNNKVPFETLAIFEFSDVLAGASATAGYIVDPSSPKPWDMVMRVGTWAADFDIAHEIGHIFGMAHEHQRKDRDKYVKYECENLVNYDLKLKKAQEKNPSIAKEDLCTKFDIAAEYNFEGFDYIAGTVAGAWDKGWKTREEAGFTYDYDSIMQYPTVTSHSKIGCAANQLDKCALVGYKNGKDRPWEVRELKDNTVPSRDDIRWVKTIYHWQA